jgi:6-phosphogluconolactonase
MNLFSFWMSLFVLSSLFACKTDVDTEKASSVSTDNAPSIIYCGTYTKKEGHVNGVAKGIHVLEQSVDGKLELLRTVPGTINPSFIALAPDRKHLYAVSETGLDVDTTAFVDTYRIDGDSLVLVDQKPSYGLYPCHISVNKDILAVSNYAGGKLVTYKLNENGIPEGIFQTYTFDFHGDHPRQEGPHLHSFTFSPDGRCGYACDLGADRIYQFGFRSDTLDMYPLERTYSTMSKSSGPRHMVFHPNRNVAYVVNELESRVVACDYDPATGNINRRSELPTIPVGYQSPNTAADIHITPDGRFLYASNRGHNSIAIYRIGEGTNFSFVDFQIVGGTTPRNFMITKDGKFLHVGLQDMNSIESYEILEDGRLKAVGKLAIATPVCLIES